MSRSPTTSDAWLSPRTVPCCSHRPVRSSPVCSPQQVLLLQHPTTSPRALPAWEPSRTASPKNPSPSKPPSRPSTSTLVPTCPTHPSPTCPDRRPPVSPFASAPSSTTYGRPGRPDRQRQSSSMITERTSPSRPSCLIRSTLRWSRTTRLPSLRARRRRLLLLGKGSACSHRPRRLCRPLLGLPSRPSRCPTECTSLSLPRMPSYCTTRSRRVRSPSLSDTTTPV